MLTAETPENQLPQSLAPVTDLWLDLCYGPHDPAVLDAKMDIFKALGFERVYFVAVAPGLPAYGSRFLDTPAQPEIFGHYGLASFHNLNDEPNRAFIEAAHEDGLEAFAVFKPYESGVGRTLPLGEAHPQRSKGLPDVGGTAYGYDAFVMEHPDMRLQRRFEPEVAALADQSIERIEINLMEGRALLEQAGIPVKQSLVPAISPTSIRLFTSDNNGAYEAVPGEHYVEAIHQAEEHLTDAEGIALSDTGYPSPVMRIEISGLSLPPSVRYLAVQWGEEGESAYLIPSSMVSLYGPDGEIPATITDKVRQQLTPLDGPRPWGDFRKDGFEFNEYGWGRRYPGWEQTSVVGIARGKNTHLKGILCEAYPEVRAYWLKQIRALLEDGADGIDIRIVGHSAMDTDYASYGYNPPVIEAFREQYGRESDGSIADFKRLMRVRGEFFEGFLAEARDLTHQYGATFQVHLQSMYLQPHTEGAFRGMVQWGMPKLNLDWKTMVDLADEITLKDHFHGTYKSERALALKRYAKEQEKPVWVHCYLTQGNDFQAGFFEAAQKDELIEGVLLYETVKRNNPNHGGVARPGIVGAAPDGSLYLDGTSIALIQSRQGKRADPDSLKHLLETNSDLRPPQ